MKSTRSIKKMSGLIVVLFMSILSGFAQKSKQPNILVIMGDDIGQYNISAYNMGVMGYQTPNIDRIGKSGVVFTDAYAQNSCTAGRAAFITGQSPYRTGLLKVGLPGDDLGLQKEDPTIAELLKPMGYRTGQFGKNHFGDKDEFLPTNHGFDEFFGNLYHLNAEEEPEHADYPKDPEFRQRFGPRGVIKSSADGQVQDTGPLTKKRMETVDDEFLMAALNFMETSHESGQPFFTWFNSSRMHVVTHLKQASVGKTGQGVYADGMREHDNHVALLLDKLDELGITENTIVVYTTDNGAEVLSWPDGGMIPFKGEKNTTWEGGFRVPMMVSWPAQIQGGQIVNDIISLEDWLPTLVAAAGDDQIKSKLLKGHQAGNTTYKVHLDGYNFLPRLTGKTTTPPRNDFFYFTDGGDLSAVRIGDWKYMFSVQENEHLDVWIKPLTKLRAPYIINLRRDPFERSIDLPGYQEWWIERMYMMAPTVQRVKEFMGTFKAYPPRQKAASWVE